MPTLQEFTSNLNNSYLIEITRKKNHIKLTFKGNDKTTRSHIKLHGIYYATFKHIEAVNFIERITIKHKRDFTNADYQNYPEIKQYGALRSYFICIEGKQKLHGFVLFKKAEINLEYIRKKHKPQKSVMIKQNNNLSQYNYSLN
jgi:hypothetical protein